MTAVAEGWRRTPSPEPPGSQNWVEVDFSRGSDYRRVLIRNPKEEALFREVVDLADWTRDDKYALAGRGIPLSQLVEERKETLKTMIDQDELEIVSDDVGPESMDSGADNPTLSPRRKRQARRADVAKENFRGLAKIHDHETKPKGGPRSPAGGQYAPVRSPHPAAAPRGEFRPAPGAY